MLQRFSSDSGMEQALAYSRAVDDGRYIFLAGTTGMNYTNGTLAEAATDQLAQCFENIEAALAAFGAAYGDIVRVRYVFTSRADFERCRSMIHARFDAVRPAATLIIAELLDPKMKLEIEVMARSHLDQSLDSTKALSQ
ncbi:MAG: Rid family hydrolase [Pseudomonadota bacterium]